jgi:hypothetical protein
MHHKVYSDFRYGERLNENIREIDILYSLKICVKVK